MENQSSDFHQTKQRGEGNGAESHSPMMLSAVKMEREDEGETSHMHCHTHDCEEPCVLLMSSVSVKREREDQDASPALGEGQGAEAHSLQPVMTPQVKVCSRGTVGSQVKVGLQGNFDSEVKVKVEIEDVEHDWRIEENGLTERGQDMGSLKLDGAEETSVIPDGCEKDKRTDVDIKTDVYDKDMVTQNQDSIVLVKMENVQEPSCKSSVSAGDNMICVAHSHSHCQSAEDVFSSLVCDRKSAGDSACSKPVVEASCGSALTQDMVDGDSGSVRSVRTSHSTDLTNDKDCSIRETSIMSTAKGFQPVLSRRSIRKVREAECLVSRGVKQRHTGGKRSRQRDDSGRKGDVSSVTPPAPKVSKKNHLSPSPPDVSKENPSSPPKAVRKSQSGRFVCDECGRVCATPTNLTVHMRTHTGEKPYSCPHCQARFRQSCHLKKHVDVHFDTPPHPCPDCDAVFRRAGDLKTHMRKHTGERPYSCCECDAAFSQSRDLKAHMKKHRGDPYTCNECGAALTLKKQTGLKTYRCAKCQVPFAVGLHSI